MSIKSMAMLLESRTLLLDCFALARHVECGRKKTWQVPRKRKQIDFQCLDFLTRLAGSLQWGVLKSSEIHFSWTTTRTHTCTGARNSVKSLDEQSEMFRSFIFNFSPIKFSNIVCHIIKRD